MEPHDDVAAEGSKVAPPSSLSSSSGAAAPGPGLVVENLPLVRVMVRRGDIFRGFCRGWGEAALRHLVKTSPYVEVSLAGVSLGAVPPAEGGDQYPSWDYPFRPKEFRHGEELHFRVLDRNSWPRKDVLIGDGKLRLTPDVWRQRVEDDPSHFGSGRRSVDKTVELYKQHEGEGRPEHTGNLQVNLAFAGLQLEPGATRSLLRPADVLLTIEPGSTSASKANGVAAGVSCSSTARQDMAREDVTSLPGVRGARMVSGGRSPEERQGVILGQYWVREIHPRHRRSVLCTGQVVEGLARLLHMCASPEGQKAAARCG